MTTSSSSPASSSASTLGLMATEQINPNTRDIDQLSSLEVLKKINREDALIHQAVEKALPQIAIVVDTIAKGFQTGGRLFYFGAGTSGRLGVLDASECLPTFGVPVEMVQGMIAGGEVALRSPVEGAEDNEEQGYQDAKQCQLTANDVLVGISASGHAPYVHGAIKAAKDAGAYTACIVCHAQSSMTTLVEQPIVVSVGPEAVAGSTRMKAGTAQKMVLNMLSTASMIQIGKTYENFMVDVQPTNSKLRARAARIVAALAKIDEADAQKLLEQTKYQVKPAIVMQVKSCGLDEANAILKAASGKLRLILN